MNFIETDRLILRRWEPKDLEPFAAMNADFRVMEFYPKKLTKEESQGRIEKFNNHIDEYGFSFFACESKATKEFIGAIGFDKVDFPHSFPGDIEIGWRIAHKFWGKGYAPEAAQAILKYAFKKLELDQIVSFTVYNNFRSARVMEKIGMKHLPEYDFHHPKIAADSPLNFHVFYRITKEEFEKIKR